MEGLQCLFNTQSFLYLDKRQKEKGRYLFGNKLLHQSKQGIRVKAKKCLKLPDVSYTWSINPSSSVLWKDALCRGMLLSIFPKVIVIINSNHEFS